MPGQVLRRVSVPANDRLDIMTGTPHEFPDRRGNRITVAAVTEGGPASGTCTLMAGTKTILEAGNIGLAGHVNPAIIGINPVIPDDKIGFGGALPGERIRCFLTNTTGLAVIMTGLVDLA